jgi:hypothetical protein
LQAYLLGGNALARAALLDRMIMDDRALRSMP